MITIDPSQLDIEQIEANKLEKQITISLLIPARGAEAADALGEIVASNRKLWMNELSVIDEIGVLIDPDSEGNTYSMRSIAREAGADWAVLGTEVNAVHLGGNEVRRGGKAGALRSLAFLAMGSHLLFHDADLRNYDPMTVGLLAAAATSTNTPRFVNSSSARLTGIGNAGGRTTEMLRSLLCKQLHRYVPEISHMAQPLIGEFIVEADLFASLPFSKGYGVETSLKVLALDVLDYEDFAQVSLPVKHQDGQDYLDLVKQFHEISFTVDVLERYFQLRSEGQSISPIEIAEQYSMHFPGRTEPLIRPPSYDEEPFLPRTGFYEPLNKLGAYLDRADERSMRRWYALNDLRLKAAGAMLSA